MRGVDTRTFAAEIGTWLDSNRLDLQGQQVGGGHHTFAAEIGTWLDSNTLPLDDIILDPSDARGLPCL